MVDASSISDVLQHSEDNNCYQYQSAAALQSPHITKSSLWPEPRQFEPKSLVTDIDLACSNRGDIITEYSKMIAEYIQFPKSTAFLHCLGCMSAAMTKNFMIKYGYSEFYANLYIVTAQPPSTGKSAINDFCFNPVYKALNEYNDRNAKERMKLEIEIAQCEKAISKAGDNEYEMDEALDRLQIAKKRLSKVALIKPTITNATIEALEREAGRQGGMFNIVSDEADSINVVLGAVYSDEKSSNKSNSELILKGWDNGNVSSTRIGRDGLDGRVRGTIAVLAQADSVDTILAAGASGRGIAERFFLLNEPSMLGKRNRNIKRTLNKSLMRQYDNTIKNIIDEQEDIELSFTEDANQAFIDYEMINEEKLGEMGEYSDDLFTGFMGKAAKQCRKLAAVLHVADNWCDGGQRSRTISVDYALWAISIFDELGKTFRASSDSLGHVGYNSEVAKLIEVISRYAEKGRLRVNVTSLRDSIKRNKPFKGSRNLTRKLKEVLLPVMEEMHYCILEGQTIYINPRLK